jgi:hypothetical protein
MKKYNGSSVHSQYNKNVYGSKKKNSSSSSIKMISSGAIKKGSSGGPIKKGSSKMTSSEPKKKGPIKVSKPIKKSYAKKDKNVVEQILELKDCVQQKENIKPNVFAELISKYNYFEDSIKQDYIVNLVRNHDDILKNICDYVIGLSNKTPSRGDPVGPSYIIVQETILNVFSDDPSKFVKIIYKKLKSFVSDKNIVEKKCNDVITIIENFVNIINKLSKIIKHSTKQEDATDLVTTIGYYVLYTEIFSVKHNDKFIIEMVIEEMLNPNFVNSNFYLFHDIMNYYELTIKARCSKKHNAFNMEFIESPFEIQVINYVTGSEMLSKQICKFIHYKILEISYVDSFEENKSVTSQIMKLVSMTYYIKNKNNFILMLRQFLEKRLIEQKKILFSLELDIIDTLSKQIAWSYNLDMMKQMVNNVRTNKFMLNTFHKNNNNTMHPLVVNNYIWHKTTSINKLTYPSELNSLMDNFTKFYESNNKILTPIIELGFGIIEFSGKDNMLYYLYANTLQIIIIMLFNENIVLNAFEISKLTQIKENIGNAILDSLFKSRIIIRNKDQTKYKVNKEFSNKDLHYAINEYYSHPIEDENKIITDLPSTETIKKNIMDLIHKCENKQIDKTLLLPQIKQKCNMQSNDLQKIKLIKKCIDELIADNTLSCIEDDEGAEMISLNKIDTSVDIANDNILEKQSVVIKEDNPDNNDKIIDEESEELEPEELEPEELEKLEKAVKKNISAKKSASSDNSDY